jgi:anti-sigma factor RsiW
MDDVELHDLTAAYALDALDPHEVEEYEAHLATCERCRAELAQFAPTTAALAYAVTPKDPPAELRDRILAAARADRPNVVPLRPRAARAGTRALVAVAAVAACAAVGLGIWNVSLHNRLDHAQQQALRSLPLSGATGSAIVGPGGHASLVVAHLQAAPSGKTYEAWVMRGTSAAPAGLFRGGSQTTVVPLSRRVPPGSRVGVTLEPAGGSAQPTGTPLITSATV